MLTRYIDLAAHRERKIQIRHPVWSVDVALSSMGEGA